MDAVALVSKFVSFFSCSVQALNKGGGIPRLELCQAGTVEKELREAQVIDKG